MKKLIKAFPVRSLAAVGTFGQALIVAVAAMQHIEANAVAILTSLWAAFMALVASTTLHNSVTPNVTVDSMVQTALATPVPPVGPPEFA